MTPEGYQRTLVTSVVTSLDSDKLLKFDLLLEVI